MGDIKKPHTMVVLLFSIFSVSHFRYLLVDITSPNEGDMLINQMGSSIILSVLYDKCLYFVMKDHYRNNT